MFFILPFQPSSDTLKCDKCDTTRASLKMFHILLKQFEGLIDVIDIDEAGIKKKIKEEVMRFKKFQQLLLDVKEKVVVDDIDIRNYAKYILREGRDVEKRELLSNLKSKISLKQKMILISDS